MRFRRAVLVALNLKYSCWTKLKDRMVATAVYGRITTSFSADYLIYMPSVGSGGVRPGLVGSLNGVFPFVSRNSVLSITSAR